VGGRASQRESSDPRLSPRPVRINRAAGLGGCTEPVDIASLAPIGADEACALIRSLRGAPLLLGARGQPALDIRAAAAALASLSRVAASHPEIAELEINPLLVTPEAVLGLDVRIVVTENGGE
jgi:hypothetical protein